MLRGEYVGQERSLARVQCQACLTPMRPGLRLCLSCGKEAIQFVRSAEGDKRSMALELSKAEEHETFHRKLREHLDIIAEETPDNLNFIIGDQRMYSKAEREQLIAMPSVLFDNLEPETATALEKRLKDDGFKVRLRKTLYPDKLRRRGRLYQWLGLGMIGTSAALAALVTPWWLMLGTFGVISVLIGVGVRSHAKQLKTRRKPLTQLRAAPAALPASDPLVARLSNLLTEVNDKTLHEQVGELALLVQRLCDHRARLMSGSPEAESLEMITRPVEPLVTLIEEHVRTLASIGEELDNLEEAVIVRAITTSEARGEPPSKRAPLREGLDRLRTLEETRAAHLQQLLEAGSLLEQVVTMGLSSDDPDRLTENYTAMAMAALGDEG